MGEITDMFIHEICIDLQFLYEQTEEEAISMMILLRAANTRDVT
jgi:hypothetical protein